MESTQRTISCPRRGCSELRLGRQGGARGAALVSCTPLRGCTTIVGQPPSWAASRMGRRPAAAYLLPATDCTKAHKLAILPALTRMSSFNVTRRQCDRYLPTAIKYILRSAIGFGREDGHLRHRPCRLPQASLPSAGPDCDFRAKHLRVSNFDDCMLPWMDSAGVRHQSV